MKTLPLLALLACQTTTVDLGESDGGDTDPEVSWTCAHRHPSWRLCEDFEAGAGDWDAWNGGARWATMSGGDDRGRVDLTDEEVHGGSHAVVFPAAASSGHQGASLDWYDCVDEMGTNCGLHSHDALYFRAWIRLAPDHRYVHHFLSIGGSQPDDFWYHGTAGCLPNGELHLGTTVDFRPESHESFFYTYFPDMSCDTSCERYADVEAICEECESKGLPTCDEQPQCCWGNSFEPDPPVPLPVDRWFCLELMMAANSVGSTDGEMAYWLDDQLVHRVEGLWWRSSPTLALNRARLQHYITSEDAQGHSNVVYFDDVVVSTERIGCE